MTSVEGVVRSGMGYDARLVKEQNPAFAEALGVSFYPGSLNLMAARPLKFARYGVIDLGNSSRIYLEARLNGLPVIISHRHPLRPPLRRRVLVFSDRPLRVDLGLTDGDRVTLEFEPDHLAPVNVGDLISFGWYEWKGASASAYRRVKARTFTTLRKLPGLGKPD